MERPDLGGGRQALEFLVVPHPLCKAWFALWVLVPGHGGKHWALAGSPPELSCGDWRGAPSHPPGQPRAAGVVPDGSTHDASFPESGPHYPDQAFCSCSSWW